jgi:predicted ester cyclase
MSIEDNKSIVRSFFEKANKDRGTPVDMCAPSFIAHIGGTQPMDLQAFQRFQEKFYASFSNNVTIIEDLIGEGNRVAFRGIVYAAHVGSFMGVPASGKNIAVQIIGFARLDNGKIVELWNSPDRLGWMQQIGAVSEIGGSE